MQTRIQKWGNSYAVRLPKATLDKLHIRAGQKVEVKESPSGKGFSVTPISHEEKTWTEIVALITPENKHSEVDWGTPVGAEVW